MTTQQSPDFQSVDRQRSSETSARCFGAKKRRPSAEEGLAVESEGSEGGTKLMISSLLQKDFIKTKLASLPPLPSLEGESEGDEEEEELDDDVVADLS
jgi:hypothetical protein